MWIEYEGNDVNDCSLHGRRQKLLLYFLQKSITVKWPITWNWAFSRRIRGVTAKKCTKKRDARAKLLFCQSKLIAFLPFSLTSPSSLLKFLNIQPKGRRTPFQSAHCHWWEWHSFWVDFNVFMPSCRLGYTSLLFIQELHWSSSFTGLVIIKQSHTSLSYWLWGNPQSRIK